MSEVNKKVNFELSSILDEVIPKLKELLKKEELLREIAAGGSAPNNSAPTWLQVLSDTASISFPDL